MIDVNFMLGFKYGFLCAVLILGIILLAIVIGEKVGKE